MAYLLDNRMPANARLQKPRVAVPVLPCAKANTIQGRTTLNALPGGGTY